MLKYASVGWVSEGIGIARNSQLKIPDLETRKRSIARWREVCLMFDDLNMLLDEAIALAEADIRNSPIKVELRQKAKNLLETRRT